MSDSNWMQEAIANFAEAMGQPNPQVLDLEGARLELRAKLILEEATETVHALGFRVVYGETSEMTRLVKVSEPDWPEVVDGLCDLVYVTIGFAVEAGFSFAPFFAEVHRSNMTKVGGPVRDDGKVLKPAGWKPPRIAYLWERVVARAKAGTRTDGYRPRR